MFIRRHGYVHTETCSFLETVCSNADTVCLYGDRVCSFLGTRCSNRDAVYSVGDIESLCGDTLR